MHVGATLRYLRLEAGFGLRSLAVAIGVSPAYLSRVELGRDPPPSPDRLVGIARVLGLPPTSFVGWPEVRSDALSDRPAGRRLLAELAQRGLSDAQLLRVVEFVRREFPSTGPATPSLASLLAPERILLGVQVDGLRDALDLLATRLASPAEASWLAERMWAREQVSPTAIGGGVALPVARLARPAAALLTLSPPLHASTPDGRPLRVLFASGGSEGLGIALRATRLAQPEVVDALSTARSAIEVARVLEAFDIDA